MIRIFAAFLSTSILGTWLGASAAHACVCDCDGDGEVTVNELVAAVNVALGLFDVSHCPSADRDGDGEVTVDEVLVGVLATLNGCPTPTATPTTGSNSPTATEIVAATNTPTTAATVTFTATATVAPTVAVTPTRTSTVGSAPTATAMSTPTAVSTATGTATAPIGPTPGAVARTCRLLAGSSQLTFQSKSVKAAVDLTGSQVWRFGVAQPDGTRAILSLPGDSHFDCLAANVLGFQVAGCLRMDPAAQARGVVDCAGGQATDGYDIVASIDHNTNNDDVGFAQDPQCTAVYRNPNDNPDGEPVPSWSEDISHPHPGVCNSGLHLDQSGAFPSGGLRMTQDLILRVFPRSACTPGLCPLDGAPFDSATGDVRVTADLSSGSAKGVIFDLNNNAALTLGTSGSGDGPNICGFGNGTDPCVTSATGAPYTEVCSDFTAGSLHGGRLVAALTALDLPAPIFDVIATIGITCQ